MGGVFFIGSAKNLVLQLSLLESFTQRNGSIQNGYETSPLIPPEAKERGERLHSWHGLQLNLNDLWWGANSDRRTPGTHSIAYVDLHSSNASVT